MSFTRVLIGFAERPKRNFRWSFCKTMGCSYITLLTTYLAKKKMFQVSYRNRKRCLLILKITLKTERYHLTTSYLQEITIQNHIVDSLQCQLQSKVYLQFCFQVRWPVISTTADPYVIIWEIITELFDSWKTQNVSIFYFWLNDTWYKRWCDYGGSDDRCAGDYRYKIILYWIFVIKTLDKTGLVSWYNYVDITVGIYMLKVAQGNSEAIIQNVA